MTRQKLLAGLTTLAVVCGAGSAAWADEFADSVDRLTRVPVGTAADGSRLSTDFENGDNGSDALGAPQPGVRGDIAGTILGFDAAGTAERTDDTGGVLVLNFDDNVCMDGAGNDVRIYDVANDDSGMIEVSNDGGANYAKLGEVTPGNYELDLNGALGHFNRIRITATDAPAVALSHWFAGIDVDAVECLHPADPNAIPPDDTARAAPDGCDLVGRDRRNRRGRRGEARPLDAGIDVEDVTITSDATSIEVTLDLCGELSDRTVYAVYFDYTDRTNLDDDPLDDGPDTLDGNLQCRRTYDHSAYYYRGRERGGIFTRTANSNQLVLSVNYADLYRGAGATEGSEVLLWVETKGRGYIRDHVPTTEAGDRCSRPQIDKEVFRVILGSDVGATGGNTGGDDDDDDDEDDDDAPQ